MVKFRFCPACGAIDMHTQSDGTDQCGSCKYIGVAMEGAPDKMNEYRKKLKNGTVRPQENQDNPKPNTDSPNTQPRNPLIGATSVDPSQKKPEKPQKISRQTTDDFEIW